jgi:phage tail sheath protein FI
MATSNKVFVSPGVYTSERDLTFVAQSVGVTTLGIVGETLKGPAFEPIFISNFDEFTSYFGGTNPAKFVNTQIPKYEAAYIAKSYLTQSNQLFVTRVLGLSGYDAGPSWSISTVANVDGSTVSVLNTPTSKTFTFTGNSTDTSKTLVTGISELPGFITNVFNDLYTKSDGDTTTLRNEIETVLSNEIVNNTSAGSRVYVFGTMSSTTLNSLTANTSLNNVTGITNSLGVSSVNEVGVSYTSRVNDTWYYSLFTESANVYNGGAFGFKVTTLNNTGGSNYNGICTLFYNNYSGTPISEYHDLVVGTLRSRGIATYGTDTGPVYQVSGTSDVMLDCSGEYSAVTKNPLSTFKISGITISNETFAFETSFNSASVNYINKVFGRSNFGKSRTDVPLFLEEEYNNLLNYGYKLGKVRGLNCSLYSAPGARSNSSTSLGWYLDKFQTPQTPYVVSELRGSNVFDLFKFVLISDGSAANKEVKISIANISFNNQTFDVIVRDFYDTDTNPVVLEKFTTCSMDINLNNYVAKKIGTSNGEFELNSRYIMIEMSEDAPVDALPCGFRGYNTRQYGTNKSARLLYKTKYNEPGEVIFSPPFTANVISNGDKVRRTYLGVSNTVGIDSDFLNYKGKQNANDLGSDLESSEWAYLTKGFHMDSGATVVMIPNNYPLSGQSQFEVGVTSFRSDPTDESNVYYKLNSRKFTLVSSGGFDGWDIYREYRTNSDRYQLGASGYLKGAEADTTYPTAEGWGAFKPYTGPNKERWANTDYYAYLWGQTTFQNPESVNINLFSTAGIDYVNNSNLVESAIDMIEQDRADSVYICTTPDYNMFVSNTNDFNTQFIYPEESVDNLEESDIDSNYTATYYPWILIRDSANNTQIYIPPTAEVVRNLALTDNIAFPWFASAGYTRGLVNAVKARKKLTQEDRDILYKGRINPIATYSDVGTVIWGNKTLQVRQSALDRINVRRLLLQARKLISAVAVRLLFEQNDEQVRQQFLDSVNPILDGIRRDRGLTDFRVVVSNTPEDLDSNTLTGKIYLKPTRSLEFIDIEFLITPTGASFEDI